MGGCGACPLRLGLGDNGAGGLIILEPGTGLLLIVSLELSTNLGLSTSVESVVYE